jgi:hypothetical protein
MIKLDKLPSIVSKAEFTHNGLVLMGNRLLVPAYIGSGDGFDDARREHLFNVIYPKLLDCGIYVLCPFKACSEYLGPFPKKGCLQEEVDSYWDKFNEIVGPVNIEILMPKSFFMFGIYEGSDVDSGLAAETGFYPGKFHKHPFYSQNPIFGVRSDFRLAENPRAHINPAIRYFIDGQTLEGEFPGKFFVGESCYDKAYEFLKEHTRQIVEYMEMKR